jgi:putative hydrolase of the HAD superfamily
VRPLRALSLDLDDTLWPIEPAIAAAEASLHDWLHAHAPVVAAAWPPPAMRELRARIAQHCPEIAHDFSAQRRLSLAHALRACGADEAQAEPAFEAFFSVRNRVALYDDALPALTRLAALLPLASLSNGNADLVRIGIDAHFAVQVSARETGVAKPDARIFTALCQRLDCAPAQVLHVGDDPRLDVAGARDAGLQAAWLNRAGGGWPGPGPAPALVFRDLSELADWCAAHLGAD